MLTRPTALIIWLLFLQLQKGRKADKYVYHLAFSLFTSHSGFSHGNSKKSLLSNKVDIALCTIFGPALTNKEICKAGDVANPLQTNPLQMGAICLEKLFAQMPGVWLLWMARIMPFSFWTNKLRAVTEKCSPTLIMVTGPFSFSFFSGMPFLSLVGGCLAGYKTIGSDTCPWSI